MVQLTRAKLSSSLVVLVAKRNGSRNLAGRVLVAAACHGSSGQRPLLHWQHHRQNADDTRSEEEDRELGHGDLGRLDEQRGEHGYMATAFVPSKLRAIFTTSARIACQDIHPHVLEATL